MEREDYDDLRDNANIWLQEALDLLNCDNVGQLNVVKCKVPVKDALATLLVDALLFVSKQNDLLTDLKNGTEGLKTELINS